MAGENRVSTDPMRFDPLDRSFVESPYEQYAVLRDEDPVHYSKLLCGWIVTRFEGVAGLLKDPTISSSIHNATPTPITEIELASLAEQPRAARTMVLLDDPDHGRIRRLMAEPFRVREVTRLRGLIAERVDAAFARLRHVHGSGAAELDLIQELAYPLPVEIFSAWLGIPDEANAEFRHWIRWVARSRDPLVAQERVDFFRALDDMHAYLEEQAERKRAEPGDDLLSYLVDIEQAGERLTSEELLAQLVTLYMAGHEPTAALIGNGVVALLHHPDQMARLREQPGLVRNAVSELLRYDGPNQFVRRVTTQPTVVGDVELPAGAVVYPCLASADRDDRRWGENADEVVVDRPDAGQHLQFGAGAHACLGSHLARLQAEIVLGAILEGLEGVELAGEPQWSARMFIRGLDSLPIRCSIRS
jgi:cytochrome P450